MAFEAGKYFKKYREETMERLQNAESALLNYEKEPDPSSLFREIKREIHTLKGSSKMLGLEQMNRVTHQMEDFLEGVSDGTEQLNEHRLDTLLALFDVLRAGADSVVENGSDEVYDFSEGDRLLKALLQDGESEDTPAAEAANLLPDPNSTSFSKSDLFAQLGLSDMNAEEILTPGELPDDAFDEDETPHVPLPTTDSLRIDLSSLNLEPPKELSIDQPKAPSLTGTPPKAPSAESGEGEEPPKNKPTEPGEATVPKTGSPGSPKSVKPQKNKAVAEKAAAGSSVDRIVDGKIQERVFQQQVKVDSSVIDNLTHHSMEANFHLMHFESIIHRFKSFGRRFHSEVERGSGQDTTNEPYQVIYHNYMELFREFQKSYDEFNNLLSQLTDSILSTKLIPLSNIFNTFPRYVRDLAKELEKKVDFVIEGQDTKLDKNILTCLNEALIHVIRNAMDHGIETPQERQNADKPKQAVLQLKAFNQGNKVVIVIRDDGRGIDLAKVKQKALEKKLVLPGKVDQLSQKELLEFIFLSGFSTSELTTDLSGRGVGMDVVRKNINRFHGQIEVDTDKGVFTEFRIILPMAMSTSQLLFVEIAGKHYGLPLEFLKSVRPLQNNEIMLHKKKLSLIENGKILEVVDIGQYLGLREELNPMSKSFLLKTTLHDQVMLLVDRVLGQKDQVVKKFDDFIGKPMFSSGATQTEDGSTVIVLDLFDLINYRGRESQISPIRLQSESKPNRILLIDDSAMTREIEASILESAGYEVVTAVDGLDGFERLSVDPEFDLIVTDIEMPRMDGFDLAKKVRATSQFSSLPIIMVTSLSKSSDRLRGLEVGANAYLTKQALAKGALLQTVRQFIAGDS